MILILTLIKEVIMQVLILDLEKIVISQKSSVSLNNLYFEAYFKMCYFRYKYGSCSQMSCSRAYYLHLIFSSILEESC